MQEIIVLVLQNPIVVFFLLSLLHAGLVLWRSPARRTKARIVDTLLTYFLLYSIGISYLYKAILHIFFGTMIAEFIGWPDSPFQREVGFACLGFGVLGLLAVRGSFDLRLGAIIGQAVFSLGAAVGHVIEMVQTGNFAPGNAGSVFYTDFLLPLYAFILLWFQHRYSQSSYTMEPTTDD